MDNKKTHPFQSSQSLLWDVATVCRVCQLSRPTIYRLVKQNAFPKKIKLSERRVAFRRADVEKWIESR